MNDEQQARPDLTAVVRKLGFTIATDEQIAALVQEGELRKAEHDDQARAEGRQFLDEERDREIIEGWYATAAVCESVDQAAALARLLIGGYRHDYGTICHAIAAASLAMAHAVERSPEGGITGFQSGSVGWMWLTRWNRWEDEPRRIVEYRNLLYPQSDHVFTTISQGIANWLRAEAGRLLAEQPDAHPKVMMRWTNIAAGRFPAFIRVA